MTAGLTIVAENGRTAVELAAREAPGLIVMDVIMPEMDGLTVLRRLKKNDATKANKNYCLPRLPETEQNQILFPSLSRKAPIGVPS